MKEKEALNDEEYMNLDEDFFDNQTHNWNPIRAWFHNSRNIIVANVVKKYYKEGNRVVDLGCGNCIWNKEEIPLTGIDLNKKMMEYAKERGRLTNYYISDLNKTPFSSDYLDLVIITETLEHLKEYKKTIKEIKRILKPNGIVITTVPFDTNFSLWKPFFAMQCFIQGTILRKECYLKKCGHINNFSPESIKEEFIKNGFRMIEQFHNKFFTIITIFSKVE